MVTKSRIEGSLRGLDRLFQKSTTTLHCLYFSKLAILELCGWIEESMDDIVLKCAKRITRDNDSINYVKDEIIRPNYGFRYRQNFGKMLLHVIGLMNLRLVERQLNPSDFWRLKSALGTLRSVRDLEAHTHLGPFTSSLDAPSVTMAKFRQVYKGLKAIESMLKAQGL